ncbi:MAG: metallophosphoesterase [Clostridia bacterium]|nr:metallophosphoesterase [Clostridia bacterium]
MRIIAYHFKNIIVSLVALILCAVNWIVPINIMKISVGPAVFETGDDYYKIVWETSLKGSGCVKYTCNGEEKIIWDSSNGIIRTDDTVHSVKVPKEELRGSTYTVESQAVPFKFGYTAFKGKTATSEPVTFRGEEKEDDINIYCISDVHEMEKKMHSALSFTEEKADIIFMIGDITSCMKHKNHFTDYILRYIADISGGEIPVVFTRGNHETRGEYAGVLGQYLGDEDGNFYYTFDFGALSAVVLDSGEDKEDSHKEYSGLVDFETLRNEEYEWLCSLDKKDFDGKYKIVFSHEPVLTDHFGKDWSEPLKTLGMELVVGGHWHELHFEDGELPVLIDGGNLGDGQWAVTVLNLKDGRISAKTVDNEGKVLLEKTIVE